MAVAGSRARESRKYARRMPNDLRSQIADRYRALAGELETAIGHALDCEDHYRSGDVPRGCAHAFALEGHLRRVTAELEALSIIHADHSTPSERG